MQAANKARVDLRTGVGVKTIKQIEGEGFRVELKNGRVIAVRSPINCHGK